jgi:peptide/nickel transport system permease protein
VSSLVSNLPLPTPRRLRVPPWLRLLLKSRKAAAGLVLLLAIVLAGVAAPLLTSYHDPGRIAVLPPRLHPSLAHPFGTTDQGADVFAQVLYGARLSLFVGFGAALVSIVIATGLGLLAAYRQGFVDEAIGVLTSVFLVLPRLPLVIALAVVVPTKSPLVAIGIISLVNWAVEMRILRAQALTIRSRDFVAAARASGESTWRIVFGEILPNMGSRIAAGFLFVFVQAIFVAAALNFLGFGDTSDVSWGWSLYWALNGNALASGEWWIFFFPGIAISLTALALTLLNYGVDELSNPKLRSRGLRRRARARRL